MSNNEHVKKGRIPNFKVYSKRNNVTEPSSLPSSPSVVTFSDLDHRHPVTSAPTSISTPSTGTGHTRAFLLSTGRLSPSLVLSQSPKKSPKKSEVEVLETVQQLIDEEENLLVELAKKESTSTVPKQRKKRKLISLVSSSERSIRRRVKKFDEDVSDLIKSHLSEPTNESELSILTARSKHLQSSSSSSFGTEQLKKRVERLRKKVYRGKASVKKK